MNVAWMFAFLLIIGALIFAVGFFTRHSLFMALGFVVVMASATALFMFEGQTIRPGPSARAFLIKK